MRKYVWLGFLGLLGACATPYQPPNVTETPPALWLGEPTEVPIGRSEANLGIKRVGEDFLSSQSRMSREGRIVDEIRYRSPFGKEIVIPANTPVHGKQLSVQRVTTNGYGANRRTEDLNANNNPMEWCFKLATQATCIFWEGANRARYIDVYGFAQRHLVGIGSATGMVGAMPNIVEGEANFGGPIVSSFSFTRIDNDGFSIGVFRKDGREAAISLGRPTEVNWAGRPIVLYRGLNFRPVRNANGVIDAVEVSEPDSQ